jgi:hypothetical protein
VDGTPLSVDQFRAAAALVGGAVAWPLEDGWDDPSAADAEPGVDPATTRPSVAGWAGVPSNVEVVAIPAGQAILWSVGPDGMDHGGVRGVEPRRTGDGTQMIGDLIFIVPLPPEAKK